MTKVKIFMLSGAGLAVIGIGLGIIFRQDLANSWHAHQKNQLALQLLKQGKWTDALLAAHDATDLRPGAADYQLTYTQTRRALLKAMKLQLAPLDPVNYLTEVHALITTLGPALDDDGEAQMQSWCTEREQPALEEASAPFDTDEATLAKVFRGREMYFVDLFSPANQTKAHTLLVTWQNFDAAETAWKKNDADRVEALLEKIPADFHKAVYDSFEKRLDGVRKDTKDRWDAANKLVVQNDFLGAQAIFADLQKHESWIPGLQSARLAAQSAGEGFFTEKMVKANVDKQYHDAGDWLFKLMTLSGQNTKGINFDNIFKGGTTGDFLNLLGSLGLHPNPKQERKNFADVLLVAANMENLTDADAAHQFLGTTYLDWATKEFQAGHFGNASYLALLATKHGNAGASELFDKAHAAGTGQLFVVVSAQPPANSVSSADKDFSDELYNAAVNTVRDSLLPVIKYEDTGNPFSTTTTNPVFRVKIQAGITQFSPDYQRNIRSVSREFPITVTVDNPAIPAARQQVEQAAQNLNAAQIKYNSDKQTASAAADATRTAASQMGGGLMGAFMGGMASGVVANSVSTAGIDAATQALADAKNARESLPLQVQETQNKMFTWNETDHTTTYHATFQIGLGVTDSTPWSQSFSASVTHKSTERRGIDQVNLAPLEREQPDVQKIESILAADLKKQFLAMGGTNALAGIHTSLQKFFAGEGAATSLDTRLNVELLWWDSPLRDCKALATTELLGKFGDVISAAVTTDSNPIVAAMGQRISANAAPETQSAAPQPAAASSPATITPPTSAIPAVVNQGPIVGVVVITGEVHSPGVSIPAMEKNTLLEVVQAAGGFTDSANTNEVRIFPQGKLTGAYTVDCAQPLDSTIHPGDHIIVRRR